MRTIIFVTALCLTFLASCNNNAKQQNAHKEEPASVSETKDRSVTPTEEKSVALQQLSPLTLDQLKAMLPTELGGAPQSAASANSYVGTSVGKASYTLTDSTGFELNIIDCGGPAGAGIYQTQFVTGLENAVSDERTDVKTIDFQGGKAIQQRYKDGSRYALTWLAKERLLVTVEGNGISPDDVDKVARGLNLSAP